MSWPRGPAAAWLAGVGSALVQYATAAPQAHWYDGLKGVHVLDAGDPDLQETVDTIFEEQETWAGQFNANRFAVLLKPGTYPADFVIPVSYYTAVYGVGRGPEKVVLPGVESLNGPNGHATNNFWRSVEGVTMRSPKVTWAVSQGAPIRRSVIDGQLFLSDEEGYSSGGFMADVRVNGTVMAAMQQQWLFRNMDMPGGIYCPRGWNYVFVGVKDLGQDTYNECESTVPGKVTVTWNTPRIAEKPYLVLEDDNKTWNIYVPRVVMQSNGAVRDHVANTDRKLELGKDIYVAKPGDDVNKLMAGKKGVLFTPGVYELKKPIVVKEDKFVILGIGFPTLIATTGQSAVYVQDHLEDVRIAGLLLEAGTPKELGKKGTAALLRWGSGPGQSSATGFAKPAGVLSDLFARVGSFAYRGCELVRADSMVEINADGVILDNTWLWHADHDDCGTDPEDRLDVYGKSDDCYDENGLTVVGKEVTAYGTAVEHVQWGDMVYWIGERGESYFFQSELPYHHDGFSEDGFVAYKVAPEVTSHKTVGAGVYIISGIATAKSGFILPATARAQNLVTVVVIGETFQFASTLCTVGKDAEARCYAPDKCVPDNRCVIRSFPPVAPHVAKLFLDDRVEPPPARGLLGSWSPSVWTALAACGLFASVLAVVAGAVFGRWGGGYRQGGFTMVGGTERQVRASATEQLADEFPE